MIFETTFTLNWHPSLQWSYTEFQQETASCAPNTTRHRHGNRTAAACAASSPQPSKAFSVRAGGFAVSLACGCYRSGLLFFLIRILEQMVLSLCRFPLVLLHRLSICMLGLAGFCLPWEDSDVFSFLPAGISWSLEGCFLTKAEF